MEIEISRYVGFAQKANQIVYGLDNLRKVEGVQLILLCSTASEKMYEELMYISQKNKVPLYKMEYITLDQVLHTENCKVVGITNNHLATQIELILNKEN
ncbi:MAG: ribosomal L7Ae/L30e/S12e/Gadd45 family protein [Clostridia bacterium]|nr:ribosomal L7Ae/L30e/S12e/Gadd45 family protein [Clostridia bacterium]